MTDDHLSRLQGDQRQSGRRRRGLNMAALLDLPEAQRELLLEITRREPVTLRELTEALDRDPIELEIQVSQMVTQDWLDVQENEVGAWVYRVRTGPRSKRTLPPGVWQVLADQWRVPIYRLFPDAVREEFSSRFELCHFAAGATLFEAGDWGERMYIVEEGRIELSVHNQAGQAFVLRQEGAGGVFGEMAVLLGERRPYTARTVDETQLWALSKSDLDALMAQHPAVGLTVRRELARYLKAPAQPVSAKSRHNPIVAVGDGASALAHHLALQTDDRVVLVDLADQAPKDSAHLEYVDGRGMRSRALVQTVSDRAEAGAWVVIATLPEMTDQLMRVTSVAGTVIDMTASGAPWMRAAARQYWVMPVSTPLQMSRQARRLRGRTTALVLSGGMARSIAHLGVLDILHSEHIAFDLHASCGYGALWSALYASGWSPQRIIDWVLTEASKLRSVTGHPGLRAMSRPGLFDARTARNAIRASVGELRFSDLGTPCYIATNNLDTGETVWLDSGSLFTALSACVARPGLVTPVEAEGQRLVDAYLVNPLPVNAPAAEQADIVLASSTIPLPGSREGPTQTSDLLSGWLSISDTVAHERSLDHMGAVDVLITPDVAELGEMAFDQAERLVERGREAAQRALKRIRALLKP